MASAGTIDVTIRINVKPLVTGLRVASEQAERYNARRAGTWNRFQMVGAR